MMTRRPLLFLVMPMFLTWAGVRAQIEVQLEDILDLNTYDGAIRPHLRQGPTRVNVSMVIHSLMVDEESQMLEVSGDLIQEWKDSKLEFLSGSARVIDTIALSGTSGASIKDRVWRPDLTAAKQVKVRGQDSDFMRINRDGHITWNQRVHYDFPCRLDLSSYPLNGHKCTLILASLGYESRELDPAWNGNPAVDSKNVVVSHGYSLKNVKPGADTIYVVQSPRRQLQLELTVEPKSGWAVKHTVIPMVATVTTAYLAFFINIRGAAARMMTCMLSLVTAAIFHESTYRKVPRAHETMAIEVFTGTCLTFIFVAAVESVVVDVLSQSPSKGRCSTSTRNSFALEPDLTEDRSGTRGQVAALWLDRVFRVLYPTAFLAFNTVYWVIYA